MVTAGSLAQRQCLACGRSSARSFGRWTAAVRARLWDGDEVLGVLPLQATKPSAPLSSNGCEDNSTPTADLQSQLWRLKPHAELPRKRAGTPGGAPAAAAAAHKVKRKRRHNRSNSGGHVEFNWPLARATAHHATDILSSQKGSGLSLQLQNNTRLGELLGA